MLINTEIRRTGDVLQQTGVSRSSLYTFINRGTFPPPISLGAKSVGYLAHEIEAVLAARAAGADENHLVSLVSELVKARKTHYRELLSALAGGKHE